MDAPGQVERRLTDPLEFARQMVALDSVSTRSNASIAALMRGWLETLGFSVEQLELVDEGGQQKVSIVGKRGPGQGGIAYFCHNDVVPADDWNAAAGGPFAAAVQEGRLWGRGACDMKGSAAAALAAIARIDPRRQRAPIYFVATSDEEHGMHGAKLVSQRSQFFQEMVAHQTVGIIGEPTELKVVNAHKGICSIVVTSRGRSAHSSTADGVNANWQLIDFLSFLKSVQARCQSEKGLSNTVFDPPTLSMNVVIRNRPAAANITVGEANCQMFLRTMPDVPWEPLVEEIVAAAENFGLSVSPVAKLPPVYTPASTEFVQSALQLTGCAAPGTVSYATDGCWFTALKDLIVLGPGSIEQAHRPDEWLALDQLQRGVEVFGKFFEHYSVAAGHEPLRHEATGDQTTAPTVGAKALAESGQRESKARATAAVAFRRAAPEDVPRVNAFLRPFVNERKLLRRTKAEMELLVPSGFLAESAGLVVGFAAVEMYSRKLAEIQCLAVQPEFQGHGIGSELVRRCVELARERGVMEVLAISSSDSFLQKIGFNYSLPDQKRALFCQLRSRDEMFSQHEEE